MTSIERPPAKKPGTADVRRRKSRGSGGRVVRRLKGVQAGVGDSRWVVGRIPVLECLRAKKRRAHRLFVLQGGKGLETIRAATEDQIPVQECTRRELDLLVPDAAHQGAVLEADPLPVVAVERWAERVFPPDALVVVLDEVQDPHNFGAVVRCAAACSACGVVFGKRHAAPLSPAAQKSAAGAMEYIDLVEAGNLARALDSLKRAGFWIAALDAAAKQLLWEADLTGRIALVVGSEGRGLRRLTRQRCDWHLRIPITGPISSLNASVSAAVALAECLRQRHEKGL